MARLFSYTKEWMQEQAKKAAQVEVNKYIDTDNYCHFHNDQMQFVSTDLDALPDEFRCDYELMDEERYGDFAQNDYDFEELFGSKDAKILVIALSYDCEL